MNLPLKIVKFEKNLLQFSISIVCENSPYPLSFSYIFLMRNVSTEEFNIILHFLFIFRVKIVSMMK